MLAAMSYDYYLKSQDIKVSGRREVEGTQDEKGDEGFFCGGENVLELDRGGGRKMLCVC